MSERHRSPIIVGLGIIAYFMAYPEDAQSLVTPFSTFLSITTAVSPSLYGFACVGIIAAAIVRTWGTKPGRE